MTNFSIIMIISVWTNSCIANAARDHVVSLDNAEWQQLKINMDVAGEVAGLVSTT